MRSALPMDGTPDAFRRRRHFDVPDAEFRQRVDQRIRNRRERADAARLACSKKCRV